LHLEVRGGILVQHPHEVKRIQPVLCVRRPP